MNVLIKYVMFTLIGFAYLEVAKIVIDLIKLSNKKDGKLHQYV